MTTGRRRVPHRQLRPRRAYDLRLVRDPYVPLRDFGNVDVWLITIGEPVPVGEGAKDRLHRTGLFAALLAGWGHRVTWWTSAFDHFRKRPLGPLGEVSLSPGLKAILLDGGGYSRNLSLARFRDHSRIARRFREAVGHDPVGQLGEDLARYWGDPLACRRIRWPLSLRVGRRAD